MEKLNIVITDKHPVVRIGLERLINGNFGAGTTITFCDDFLDVQQFARVNRTPIDLLIVGHAFEDVSEIYTCISKVGGRPGLGLPVLVFSELEEEIYAPLCFAAGVLGFVHKSAWFPVLIEAIDTVLKGGYFVNGKPIRRLEDRQVLLANRYNPIGRLSQREKEIAKYLVDGYSCMQISDKLNLHRSTVSTLKSCVFKKLRVTTDAQFAMLWSSYRSIYLNTENTWMEKIMRHNPVRFEAENDGWTQLKVV